MRLESTAAQQISNVAGQSTEYRVGNLEIIMELLSKLYSDPVRTPIQEYISNARDANREAGSKTPIRVTVPSRLEPLLRIRDYGYGLSPDAVREVFTVYGASTKTKDNTQTGGFGIGAKSAWAYTDSFTVTSWHDGMVRQYVCHKSGGTGTMQLLHEAPSDEPSGVEIGLAAKPGDLSRFKEAVQQTVKHWQPEERPTVVGMDVEWFDFSANKITDRIYSGSQHSYKHTIILEGIPYTCPKDLNIKALRTQLTIFADTGQIDPAPTRENLKDNEKLSNFLEKINRIVTREIQVQLNLVKVNSKTAVEFFSNQMFDWFNMPQGTEFRGLRLAVNHWSGYEYKDKIFQPVEVRRKTLKWRDMSDHVGYLDRIYYDDTKNKKERAAHIRGALVGQIYLVDQQYATEFAAKPLSSLTPKYNYTATGKRSQIATSEFQAWKNGAMDIYTAAKLPAIVHYLPGQNIHSNFAQHLYGADIYALSKKAINILTAAGKTLVNVKDAEKDYVPNKDDLLYLALRKWPDIRGAVIDGFISLNYNVKNVKLNNASSAKRHEVRETKEYKAVDTMVQSLQDKYEFALMVYDRIYSTDRTKYKQQLKELFK